MVRLVSMRNAIGGKCGLPAAKPEAVIDTCPPHHWLIETASGPGGSLGKCRKCGVEKSFLNHIPIGFPWPSRTRKDDTSVARPNRRVRSRSQR